MRLGPWLRSSYLRTGGLLFAGKASRCLMFDCVSHRAEDLRPDEMASVLASAALASSDGVADKFDQLKVYGQRGQTVILKLSDCSLSVKGSLPTFLQGHNNDLLPFEQFGQAARGLAEWVGLPPERLKTCVAELSVDTPLASPAQSFLESLRHRKGKKFHARPPKRGTSQPLEYLSTQTNVWVKFYDQSKYAAQEGYSPTIPHKVRYEVVGQRARAVSALLGKGKATVTLADLATPATYAAAAATLLRVFGEVVRERPLDFTGLKPQEMNLLQSGGSPDHWKELKKNVHINTYKQYRKDYNRLRAEHDERTKTDVYGDTICASVAASLATSQGHGDCTFFHTLSQLESGTLPSLPHTLPASQPAADDEGRKARALPAMQIVNDEVSERPEGSRPARTPAVDGEQHTPDRMVVSPHPVGQRYCHTCGLPINTGNSNAKFCSPKERGEQHAHRCRNADSNARLDARRKRQAQRRRVGGTLPLPFTA